MYGARLVRSVLDASSPIQTYLGLNLDKEMLRDVEHGLFDFIDEHISKYGAFPSAETLHEAYVEKKVETEIAASAPEPPEFYLDHIRKRHQHQTLKAALLDTQQLLNQENDLDGAIQRIGDVAMALLFQKQKNRIVNFADEGHDLVMGEYLRRKQNLNMGLPLGWPTLDKMTNGLEGGDVVSIVGRPAQGKTFLILYAALSAFKAGFTPLVVSMEMKPLPILQRLSAMYANKSLTNLKAGQLSDMAAGNLKTQLQALIGTAPFWVVDGALTSSVQDILMLARQLRPSVVYIDGAYLLRNENTRMSRWEKLTENAERIKSDLAEGLNIPVVISYQFNRQATKKAKSKKKEQNESVGLEDIGYTDAIGQLSSLVLGIMQEPSVETLVEREIDILKGRHGEVGRFKINWLFDQIGGNFMNFSEKENKNLNEVKWV